MPDNTPEKPSPTAFGLELASRRNAKGLKQAEAARMCGVGRATWNNIELGYESLGKDADGIPRYKPKSPSREFVIAVADGLEWPRAEALKVAGFSPEPDPRDQPLNLPPVSFLDDWRAATREQQEAIAWLLHLMRYPHAAYKGVRPTLGTLTPSFVSASGPDTEDSIH